HRACLHSLYAQSFPVVLQLIAVDPSNPSNYQLMAYAYAGLRKHYDTIEKEYEARAQELGKGANTSKSPAVVKAAVDSAARMSVFIKAYEDSTKTNLDSTLKYNALYTDFPV